MSKPPEGNGCLAGSEENSPLARGALSLFRRPDGAAGVRNHVLVLGVNGLALRVAERIARTIPGAICVASGNGRGQIEPDLTSHLEQLAGLGGNPNVAAVLVVGVDAATTDFMVSRIAATGKPTQGVSFSEAKEDVLAVQELGVRRLAQLAHAASRIRRESGSLADLFVGVECGHSDATSGIASNRVIGATVDALVDAGATVVVGETVEWLGAEHLLARRARTSEIGEAILQAVKRREDVAAASGRSLTGNNPGEENIRGGLSTIEEKSLGAIIKSGSRPIDGLLGLTERPARRGLYMMDGPAFSPESITGFNAIGAQLVLFSTGPGNSYASALSPTIKITAQRETSSRLPAQIDVDVSGVFSGDDPLDAAAQRLIDAIADVAEGSLTWGEVLGEGFELPTRIRGSL
jgi:altronate dehydratase large subunit